MKWRETGLILLSMAAFAGLFVVITVKEAFQPDNGAQEEVIYDPLGLLEQEFSTVCYGSQFRIIHPASGDTLVRSMDLIDSISIHQANLIITRALDRHGFNHVVTYSTPDKVLSFICHTAGGQPVRFELNDIHR